MFFCPSDNFASQSTSTNNSYAGNQGTAFEPGTQDHGQDGVFTTEGGPIGPPSVSDGLTNTAGITEWVRGQLKQAHWVEISHYDVNILNKICSDSENSKLYGYKSANWLSANFGDTLYNYVMNINENTCVINNRPDLGAWTAGSDHGSGVNVLYMDGHVSFVKDSIGLSVWRATGTRKGGEIIDSDD